MTKQIEHIVIVGGGTAGWLTAGRIAAQFPASGARRVSVTLVESPTVKTVGVGEGTWPTMRTTLMKMGVSESDFIRCCDATFKQGAKFKGWVTGTPDDYYYHPLMLPQGFDQVDIAAGWHRCAADRSFSDAVCFQESVCEHGLAPKLISTAEYGAIANYAYHLDAAKFAAFLQAHVTQKLGVTHLRADVIGVQVAEDGDIASLRTTQCGSVSGDLFVDCSGFRSLLLGEHYQVPFIDHSDVLFIDQALAVHLPYTHAQAPIASHTVSTAQDAGWVWDIGLQSRRGVGYVYSSRHTSQSSAEKTLRDYARAQVSPSCDVEALSLKSIPIRCGHRAEFWRNNCVAVGLSAGFLEPLEASALVLVELSAAMIAEQLPVDKAGMAIIAKRFNRTFRYRWDRVIEFLKLHYLLTRRQDTAFWRDNCDPATVPEGLRDLLTLWAHRAPANFDFDSNNEVFPAASYQYVLYGMGFTGALHKQQLPESLQQQAQHYIDQAAKASRRATQVLPEHRALIEQIKTHGMARI